MSIELFQAIARRDILRVKQLLGEGVDPNQADADLCYRPLFAAIEEAERGGPVEIIALLLHQGARATINEVLHPNGPTALGWAASRLDIRLIELLMQAGANPSALDDRGRKAVELLPPCSTSNEEEWHVAELLLRQGFPGPMS